MAKLIFIIEEDQNREASKIEFEVPNDMDVWEYKRMCVRMAGAMGYTSWGSFIKNTTFLE